MVHHVAVDGGGGVALPDEVLAALGAGPGDALVLVVEDGMVELVALDTAVRRAQACVAAVVGEGRSLSSELIAERRAEAQEP